MTNYSKLGSISYTILSNTGQPVIGAQVSINVSVSGTPAILYADREGLTPILNPVLCDSLGRFQVYTKQNNYDLIISGPGITSYTITDVSVELNTYQSPILMSLSNGYVGNVYLNYRGNLISLYSNDLKGGNGNYFLLLPVDLRPLNNSIVIGYDTIVTTNLKIVSIFTNGECYVDNPSIATHEFKFSVLFLRETN